MSQPFAGSNLGDRLKKYVASLPIVTKGVGTIIFAVYLVQNLFRVPLSKWFSLDPAAMDFSQLHRLNTYPLVHLGIFHMLFNLVALAPLLERFEKEHGSLLTLLHLLGPITTFPAALYLGIQYFLRSSTPVVGASAWVFTFLANEAIRTYALHPNFTVAGVNIPTWTTPILTMVVMVFLVPGSSLIGHFCGLLIGYAFGKHYLRKLATPEWILRKAETILPLKAIPSYVSLENRQEPGYSFILPRHTQDSTPPTPVVELAPAARFAGQGRTLDG